MITGGGTGGHLFPAIAAAQALTERIPGSCVLFVGTKRTLDAKTLERYGFAHCSITSYGIKGKNIINLMKALAVLPLSLCQAFVHILRFKPDVVLGVGGYVTGPVLVAAKLLGVATVIHEQNSVPGMANRKLAKLVDKICISLPDSAHVFPVQKTTYTGNPVRQELLALAEQKKEPGTEKITLLVLGGSQGARAINDLIVEIFCGAAKETLHGIRLVHQTGQADFERIQSKYNEAGRDVVVAPFFEDMAAVYNQADLLLSRAGATTLTELAVLGKPVILVPYPYAADDHQKKNGEYYVQGGGAILYEEKELDASLLAETIATLIANAKQRQIMAAQMRTLAMPDAAMRIVAVCLEAARRS